jgi:hypothetical protein
MWKHEMHTKFWYGNMKDKNHMENLGVDGMIIQALLHGVS